MSDRYLSFKTWLSSMLLAGVALLLFSCSTTSQETKVLVFTKTAGYRHSSIAEGLVAIQQLGQQHHFLVDTTEEASAFTEENLKKYQAVIFLNTTGDVLDPQQQNDFERFIQAGGGFVGIHAAADTEYGWPWYGKLVGAYFESHPNNPNVQKGVFRVVNKTHPSADSLPERWEREDEFYNFKNINPAIKVVLTIDETTYPGGTNGSNHPMAWYHDYDGGRAFYTNLGHTEQSFSEPLFLKHLWGGINYALGGEEPKSLNYDLAKSERIPEESRFTKVVLDEKLDEPTEMVVMSDNRVLFLERKGNVKLYDPLNKKTKVIATIPVSTKYNPDKEGKQKEAEDGLLGLALDPDFDKNHWIYIYYSPVGDEPKNVLARFVLNGENLDLNSRKVILDVPTQRDECCHTGGSLTFDAHGNLFLSTGDNTNPFASKGYSPSDEGPGRSAWDAQRSSGNTNDLRGKILRIHPQPDGSYTIPEGNLFPKGTANTRPEIYVMGNRNPYRISVDKKTDFLYWGEVGPDAGFDTITRGPRGHDEVNQARKAGFFGWPYFVGDNKPYREYDFATGISSPAYNAAAPINNSPNNTGLQNLPPAQKAMIYYPYAESTEFPLVGSGGRNAMAGPVFYSEDFKGTKRPFPDYYNGKFFAYEWMRGWIMAVTMDKEGNMLRMERFMPSTQFDHPMDMQFGPDGDLYILEYGTKWFAQNNDARLVRIEYNSGNRKPVAQIEVNHKIGAAPLAVQFSSKGTKDYDQDKLEYQWNISSTSGAAASKTLTEQNPKFTFDQPGVYKAVLTVTDTKGEKASAETEIEVGNEPPVVDVVLTSSNQTFFFPNQSFDYQVKVKDREDGSTENGSIAPDQVAVSIDYMKEGFDKVEVVQGHRMADASVAFTAGKNLIESSDCKACHSLDSKSIGPAYKLVAQKYKGDAKAVDYLAAKIIKGGGGVWGENAMSAHPQLSVAQTTEMVKYILSLADGKAKTGTLPTKGSYTAKLPADGENKGVFIVRAAYTDKGANSIAPLTAEKVVVLRSPNVLAFTADQTKDVQQLRLSGTNIKTMIAQANGAYVAFNKVDLATITQITLDLAILEANAQGGKLEVHLDSPTGTVIGETSEVVKTANGFSSQKTVIKPTAGVHDLYFVFRKEKAVANKPLFALIAAHFQGGGKASAGATGASTGAAIR